MKISFQWLNDHIDLNDFQDKAPELARLLTHAGLEVESVEDKRKQFDHIVVGKIEKLDKHPNADRLTVCQIDAGEGSLRQIVCGAKNHRQGDKVVVTLPGAVLPGNFAIKKSKIRDVESLGMLASESELGFKAESEGILILPADAPVGRPFAEYYGLGDIIFEVNVTVNRADCLSHLGLARELSALLDRPLKKAGQIELNAGKGNGPVAVDVRAPQLCTRYTGRVIEGVKVGPSPQWLARRLESVGLNSINNVVDVTNFVMLDLGQPLHAFDMARLKGQRIIVDRAPANEKFTTFDGTQLTLTGDELTIRDAERAVCIAGVVGTTDSGVQPTTVNLFIESAHFTPDSVRRTARRHGLVTDSAYRFSRGTDPSGVRRALHRACQLIQEVAGGKIHDSECDVYPQPTPPPKIAVRVEDVGQRLGYAVDEKDFVQWMKRLGCTVSGSTGGPAATAHLQVCPPEYRVDLHQDVDLVEEFGRLNGYDHIPDALPPMTYAPLKLDAEFIFEQRLTELARAQGFSQCVNFAFIGSKYQAELLGLVAEQASEIFRSAGLDMPKQAVAIQNPLNEDMNVMRVSLLPGLLKNLLHNYRHGLNHGRLFELGQVFRQVDGKPEYAQSGRLSFVSWGHHDALWEKSSNAEAAAFFSLKGSVQSLLERLLIQNAQFEPWTENCAQLLHPAQMAIVKAEGRAIGFVGAIHPQWLMDEKVRVKVVVCELDVTSLMRGQPRTVKFKSVSKFPAVERDLAFLLPRDMLADKVTQVIKKTAGPILQSVEIFDIFSGHDKNGASGLPDGHISVAYRMVFQDQQATLSDERLAALQDQIVSAVQSKLQVRVR